MKTPVAPARIVFIGAGNMTTALVKGLFSQDIMLHNIMVASPRIDQQHPLCQQCKVQTTRDNVVAAEQADILILAVKPQVLQSVASGIRSVLQQRQPLVISLAAGVRIKTLVSWLGENIPIVRSMPNLPVTLQAGMISLYADSMVTSDLRGQAESLFSSVGVILWAQSEEMLDIVTAVSGSGPGYVFLMQEAMEEAARHLGIDAASARLLTTQTFLGAAQMAASGTLSPADLRAQVCSPGGTTEAGIQAFQQRQVKTVFREAIDSAWRRALELAQ